jgi:transposase
MSFVKDIKRGASTYVYKITSYWDSDKQQSRNKREYLGIRDKKTKKIISPTPHYTPKTIQSFGLSYLILNIFKELKLKDLIQKHFPKNYNEIINFSAYKTAYCESDYLYPRWKEENYLEITDTLCSQRISDLYQDLGTNEKQVDEFIKSWVQNNTSSKDAIMFDITSISSYTENNDLFELGYNRDLESLKQVNLGVVYNSTTQIPLAYKTYQGSLNDVNTLENIAVMFSEYKIKVKTFCFDRGFFSDSNIIKLSENKVNYVISAAFKSNQIKDLARKLVSSLDNVIKINSNILSYHYELIKIGKYDVHAHVYLDEEKQIAESNILKSRIYDIDKSLKTIKTKQEAKDIIGKYKRFYKIDDKSKKLAITKLTDVIQEELGLKGKFILLTYNKKTAIQALLTYRNRDCVEKMFNSFKNDLNLKRLKVHSSVATKGKLFISFIALIITSHIKYVISQNTELSKLTLKEVFFELNKIKNVTFSNDKKHFLELTKKQNLILKAFKIKKLPA